MMIPYHIKAQSAWGSAVVSSTWIGQQRIGYCHKLPAFLMACLSLFSGEPHQPKPEVSEVNESVSLHARSCGLPCVEKTPTLKLLSKGTNFYKLLWLKGNRDHKVYLSSEQLCHWDYQTEGDLCICHRASEDNIKINCLGNICSWSLTNFGSCPHAMKRP